VRGDERFVFEIGKGHEERGWGQAFGPAELQGMGRMESTAYSQNCIGGGIG
jgi:hypothetical protein